MASPGTTVELSLADFAALAARRAEDLARLDFTRPLRTIAVLVAGDTRLNFTGQHAPDGSPWLPLRRPRTLPASTRRRIQARRRRTGERDQILRDTDVLMASVTSSGAPRHIGTVSPHRLTWGTNLEYAGFLQDGTRFMPARPFLGMSSRLQAQVNQVLAEFVAGHLGGGAAA